MQIYQHTLAQSQKYTHTLSVSHTHTHTSFTLRHIHTLNLICTHAQLYADTLPHPFQLSGPGRKMWNLASLGPPSGLWLSSVEHSQAIGLNGSLIPSCFSCLRKNPQSSFLNTVGSHSLEGTAIYLCSEPLALSTSPLLLLSLIPRPLLQ